MIVWKFICEYTSFYHYLFKRLSLFWLSMQHLANLLAVSSLCWLGVENLIVRLLENNRRFLAKIWYGWYHSIFYHGFNEATALTKNVQQRYVPSERYQIFLWHLTHIPYYIDNNFFVVSLYSYSEYILIVSIVVWN